jgi:hypothetical protein
MPCLCVDHDFRLYPESSVFRFLYFSLQGLPGVRLSHIYQRLPIHLKPGQYDIMNRASGSHRCTGYTEAFDPAGGAMEIQDHLRQRRGGSKKEHPGLADSTDRRQRAGDCPERSSGMQGLAIRTLSFQRCMRTGRPKATPSSGFLPVTGNLTQIPPMMQAYRLPGLT